MAWYGTKKASKLPSMDKSRILVFDVETTGLSATLDEIIQITILNGYGNELFSSYIKPTRHKVWTEAQRVNGIRYSMLKDAPTFKQVKKKIQKIFNNALLVVGYNVGFDIEFVEAAGIVVGGTRFDVMTAFASYRKNIEHSFYKTCKLSECAEYFGYSFDPHNASEDARATLYCFDALIADKRFTTYKREEKKQLQKREEKKQLQNETPVSKKKTRFTVAFKGGWNQSILLGLILFVIGITVLVMLSNIVPKDMEAVQRLFFYIKENFTSDPKIIISVIVAVIGGLMVIVRILRMIIMFPKWVLVHVQRLFKHF